MLEVIVVSWGFSHQCNEKQRDLQRLLFFFIKYQQKMDNYQKCCLQLAIAYRLLRKKDI